ncbi:MAG: hypothetical protein ACYS32_19345 [Planctomycetota bacterium]|jgi:hypothetical protein
MPSVTLNIPTAKYTEYKKYFLLTHPNQTDDLTDDQWIKHRILLFAKGAYQKAKRVEWEEGGPIVDDDIITEG